LSFHAPQSTSNRPAVSTTVRLTSLSEDAAVFQLTRLLEDSKVTRPGTHPEVEVTGLDLDSQSEALVDFVFFACEMLTENGVTVRLS
jgi:hypothetical protein